MSKTKNLAEILLALKDVEGVRLILDGDDSVQLKVDYVNISYFLAMNKGGHCPAVRPCDKGAAVDLSVSALVGSKRVAPHQFIVKSDTETYTLSIIIQVPLGDARLGLAL